MNVELQEGLVTIGSKAFRNCTSLERIIIPSSVEVISVRAFCDCSQLMYVELQEGLVTIEERAFHNCTLLERVSIPSTVIVIAVGAFEKCPNLVEIEFCQEVEQFVNEVQLPWWNRGVSENLLRTYTFLIQDNIIKRLGRV